MQTFLPYSDFAATAKVLDYRRLGKQRVETYQIIKALTEPNYGWKNHPAVKQWEGHVGLLAEYGTIICKEWINRGYKDTMLERFYPYLDLCKKPWWLGYEPYHQSHRNMLLLKSDHYKQYFKQVGEAKYLWPTESIHGPYN